MYTTALIFVHAALLTKAYIVLFYGKSRKTAWLELSSILYLVYFINIYLCEESLLSALSAQGLILAILLFGSSTPSHILIIFNALPLFGISTFKIMVLPGIFKDAYHYRIYHPLDFMVCCLLVHIPKYGVYVRQKSRRITEKLLFPIVLSGIALFVPYIIASSNSITISYVQMVCLTELAVELNTVQHIAETNTPLSQLKHNIVPNSEHSTGTG